MFKDWYTLQREYNEQVDIKEAGYYSKNISTLKEIREKLNDIAEDIDYQLNSYRSTIRGFFVSLYNFWKFRKVIFRDRFWDYSFLVDIMVFKLKDMEDNWVKNTHYEGDKFTKGRITIIRKRLESLEEDIEDIQSRHLEYLRLHDVSDDERLKIYKAMRKEIRLTQDKVFKTLGRNIRNFWD